MLNNNFNSFFNEYENIYNCIPGKEILEDEMKQINKFIDFDFNNIHNLNCHSIHNFFIYKDEIFKIDESIKFNKLKYEIVEKNKKNIINLKMMKHYILKILVLIYIVKKNYFYILKFYYL
jgi:hypothetical protein